MRESDKSTKSAWRQVRATCRAFGRDRDGSALFYTTLSLPVLIGFALLTIDGSRFMNLHSTLQHAADGLALAAAGELNRAPDACGRAEVALANLVENDQRFGDAGAATITINDVSWRFLSALPASDADPIPDSMVLNPCESSTARFIEVTVDPQSFTTLFPASFVGGSDTAATNANAVAGYDFVACKIQPMFMCNPFEPEGNTNIFRATELYDHIADRAKRRRQIEFKKHAGGGAQWAPGNFGFLEADLGPGANALGDAIATNDPPVCVIQNGVYTQPGTINVIRHAFNVRFDRYHGTYSANNPSYLPAPNVRKGYEPDTCNNVNAGPVPPNMGFPRDACFAGGTCAVGNRIGIGDWDDENDGGADFEAYWTTNFGTTPPPADENGVLFSDLNLPTRHEIYMYEIDNDLNMSGPTPPGATANEKGAPYCHIDAASASDPDRRIFNGAILNCIAQPIDGGSSGGPYFAVAFGEFFMTEPMIGPTESLYMELSNVLEPGTANTRALVQLYR